MQFENWQEGMHASFTASNKAEHEQHIIMTTQLPFVLVFQQPHRNKGLLFRSGKLLCCKEAPFWVIVCMSF